jgi:hypothetical protein
MESAAKSGQLPPPWVQVFISSAGWERYEQLCQEYSHQAQRPGDPDTSDVISQSQQREASTTVGETTHTGAPTSECARLSGCAAGY